jgi:hypothetical protein
LIIGLRFVGWDVLCLLIFPTAKKCLDVLCPTEHSIPGRPIAPDRARVRSPIPTQNHLDPVSFTRPVPTQMHLDPVQFARHVVTLRLYASSFILLGIVPHFASARSSYAISLDPPPIRSSGRRFPAISHRIRVGVSLALCAELAVDIGSGDRSRAVL